MAPGNQMARHVPHRRGETVLRIGPGLPGALRVPRELASYRRSAGGPAALWERGLTTAERVRAAMRIGTSIPSPGSPGWGGRSHRHRVRNTRVSCRSTVGTTNSSPPDSADTFNFAGWQRRARPA